MLPFALTGVLHDLPNFLDQDNNSWEILRDRTMSAWQKEAASHPGVVWHTVWEPLL